MGASVAPSTELSGDIDALASEEAVEPAAMKEHLTEFFPGIVSTGTYLPASVIEELQEKIDSLESMQLSEINPLLDEYGVGQDALEKIGYSVRYVSLNQDEATVSKQ